jgi:hypothetical protein
MALFTHRIICRYIRRGIVMIDETRLRACEKELQDLKIHMTLLLDILKFEKELPILGPGRFENFVNSLRQALAHPHL